MRSQSTITQQIAFFICTTMICLLAIVSWAREGESVSITTPASSVLGSEANPIKVGVLMVPPFVQIKNGQHEGLAIEYWQKIAAKYGWHYQFIDAGQNYSKATFAASKDQYHVVLGNFSTFYERGKLVDFSRPFLLNYVSVLTSTAKIPNVFFTLAKVAYRLVLPIILIILCIMIGVTWFFCQSKELSKDHNFFVNAFYVCMAVCQGQVYSNKPNSTATRVILLLLAFCSVFFLGTFSAAMTDTLLIMDVPIDPLIKIQDVKGKTFVLEQGSGFVDVVKALDGKTVEIAGLDSAALHYYTNRHKYDGFVADHALINMLDKNFPAYDVIQSGINLRNDELVFLFNKDFPYKGQVDLGILELQDSNMSILICARYLGVDSKLCIL